MYLQLKFSSDLTKSSCLFTYYVEANREVEGPSQKRLVINNSALIIKVTAISGFIKKFRITIIVDTE